LVEVGLPPFELTTPISGKPTLEELEENQCSGKRLTLVERQTLLAYEVKRKQKKIGTSSIGKHKETRKPIDHPILEQIYQPMFETTSEQTKQVENTQSQFVTKTFEIAKKDMTGEGQGSNIPILTPKQRVQYEKKQKEWKRKREEETRREAETKREEDSKREYHHKIRQYEKIENDEEATFGIPILDTREILGEEVKMKNIPPSVLPNFYGMSSEGHDSLMFEFDILCHTYGYTNDTHKLHLFPTTLKEAASKWFMGLGEHTITAWEDMRKFFLRKYQPYYRPRDSNEDTLDVSTRR